MDGHRPMSAAAFKQWRSRNGLSERSACDKLGCSRGALRNFEEKGAPLYIGLAIAALDAGLEPVLRRT